MSANHVVIWVDHREAHVLYFDASLNQMIKADSTHPHLHHKANEIGSGNAPDEHAFFHKVISAVKDVHEILIVGPGSAKNELQKHAVAHDSAIAKKIVGVETVDHPTDGQVLNFAKKYFQKIDQLRGI
ncbi:translational machinery protein [Polynucleobacter paludilacus]|uniref:translational machinery protein n=1 Tax=Polynucleobacter paludilacus TaxID=1855895 RepID=UPI001BFE4CB5|nr:translational machinery protein [Polynucleobacter paludilacus]QWD87401.1 translational machinery protein [Polynucleobacter paludilacus]